MRFVRLRGNFVGVNNSKTRRDAHAIEHRGGFVVGPNPTGPSSSFRHHRIAGQPGMRAEFQTRTGLPPLSDLNALIALVFLVELQTRSGLPPLLDVAKDEEARLILVVTNPTWPSSSFRPGSYKRAAYRCGGHRVSTPNGPPLPFRPQPSAGDRRRTGTFQPRTGLLYLFTTVALLT